MYAGMFSKLQHLPQLDVWTCASVLVKSNFILMMVYTVLFFLFFVFLVKVSLLIEQELAQAPSWDPDISSQQETKA